MADKDQKILDPKMLELLVCPHSKSSLTYDEGAQELHGSWTTELELCQDPENLKCTDG